MTTKLEEIQVLFQVRNARKRGPTSSDEFNDMLEELAHDLSEFNDQWNNRLVPITDALPDGTITSTVDAFTNGLDGGNIYLDQNAAVSSSYYNSSASRPNTVLEQINSIYSTVYSIRDDLENQITNNQLTAGQISIVDSGALYSATNVENALAEVKLSVDLLESLSFSSIGEELIPTADNVFNIGSSSRRWKDLYLGPASFHIYAKAAEGGGAVRDFTMGVDPADGAFILHNGGTTLSRHLPAGGIQIPELASNPTQKTGFGTLYTKTDGKLYFRDSTGFVTDIAGAVTEHNELHLAADSDNNEANSKIILSVDGTQKMEINATGFVLAGGPIDVTADTDTVSSLGRARIGYNGTDADSAVFAHYDRMSNTAFALKQSASGATVLNAMTGTDLSLAIDGTAKWHVDNTTGDFVANTTAQLLADDSSSNASAPGFSFVGNTDTGIFQAATNALGFTTSGIERVRITSDGRIGIGTTSVPHGTTGWARLAIDGADTSGAGPHVQYTTSNDDYPVFQQLNYAHDNIALNFDCYYNSSWLSSDVGSNFQIYKTTDELLFRYGSGVTVGTSISWNTGISLDATTGNVGVGIYTATEKFEVYDGNILVTGPYNGAFHGGISLEPDTATNVNRHLKIAQDSVDTEKFEFKVWDTSSDVERTAGTLALLPGGGTIGIGTTDPLSTLHVNTSSIGAVTPATIADDLTVENNDDAGISLLTPNNKSGTLAFGDPDDFLIGWISYDHTADKLIFGANNADRWVIDSDGDFISQGTYQILADDSSSGESAPGYSFTGNANTGMFQIGSNQIGFSANGTEMMRVDTNGVGIGGATYSGAQLNITGSSTYRTLRTFSDYSTNSNGLELDMFQRINHSSGAATSYYGIQIEQQYNHSSTGTVSNVAGIYIKNSGTSTATSSVTSAYGIYIDSNSTPSNVVDSLYGLRIGNVDDGAVNNFSIQTALGKVFFGDITEIQTGTTVGQEALQIDQNDADQAFIDYAGTSEAGTTKNITSYTTGNSIQGFVKIEINGTAYWMPYYNAPTS